jgi:thioesterase domain-containing protein
VLPNGRWSRQQRTEVANIEAWASYRPRPHTCPLTLIATRHRLEAIDDPTLGWGLLTTGAIDVHPITGFHADLTTAFAGEVAEAIEDALER